jgi:hypothetical protein
MKAGLPGCEGANLYLGTDSLRRENHREGFGRPCEHEISSDKHLLTLLSWLTCVHPD